MTWLPDEVIEARFDWEPYPHNDDYEWAYIKFGERWIIALHQIKSTGMVRHDIGWRAIAITKSGENCEWSARMEEMVAPSSGQSMLGPLEITCVFHQFVERYK